MDSKTFPSIIIMLIFIFGTTTFYKLENFPKGDCCRDLENVESKKCQKCDKYTFVEKVIYVWKFP